MTDKNPLRVTEKLPFDPRETGPLDVLDMALGRLNGFIEENSRELIAAGVVLLSVAWWAEISLPRVPDWVLILVLTAVAAAPSAWVVGNRLAAWLWSPDFVLLSEVNAATGDQRLIRISPERFDELDVENHEGKTRDRSFLHEVIINGERAYEVDRYNAEVNLATASWMAGATNAQIRADRSQIERIKTSLEREADKALELMAHHPEILRDQLREVAKYVIAVAEDVELPAGSRLHERLTEVLEASDPSSDLLGDVDGTNGNGEAPEDSRLVDLEDTGGMDLLGIFGRAAEEAQK